MNRYLAPLAVASLILAVGLAGCAGDEGASTPTPATATPPSNNVAANTGSGDDAVLGAIDQSFEGPFGSVSSFTSDSKLSQLFTPTKPTIVAVELLLRPYSAAGDAATTSQDRVITVTIADPNNKGIALGSASLTVPAGTPGSLAAPAVVRVTFDSPVTVTPGWSYAIQASQDGLVMLQWVFSSAGTYAGGLAYTGTSPITNGKADFGFRTYGAN